MKTFTFTSKEPDMMKKPPVDLDSKPSITIDLKPHLEAYCRMVFNSPVKQKKIVLSRRHHLGKLIFGHIFAADIKLTRPLMDNPVTFILPTPRTEIGYMLQYRNIYFPMWCTDLINDCIEADFRLWLRERFWVGYERKGWEQQRIVLAILRRVNLRNNAVNFDMIKKIDYRNRRENQENDAMELCNYE